MGRMILLPLAATLGLTLPPAQASADVFEIHDGGVIAVRTGAGGVVWAESGSEGEAGGFPTAALTPPGDRVVPAPWAGAVARIAFDNGLSPALVEALACQESRWNPAARSPAGVRDTGLRARDLPLPRPPHAG